MKYLKRSIMLLTLPILFRYLCFSLTIKEIFSGALDNEKVSTILRDFGL